jgi:hypothetical protein
MMTLTSQEVEAHILSVQMNLNREKNPERIQATQEHLAELKALQNRLEKGVPVGPTLTSLRARLIIRLNPGITKTKLKEILDLPPSAKSDAQKVFRDFLRSIQKSIVIDENDKLWIAGDPKAPKTASRKCRIGKVVLDGTIKNNLRTAILLVRNKPGITKDELFVEWRYALDNPENARQKFNKMVPSLLKYVDQENGKFFVKGYIPVSETEPLPPKTQESGPTEPLSLTIFETLIPGVRYEWAEILREYQIHGILALQAYKHLTGMIREGWIKKDSQGNFFRF